MDTPTRPFVCRACGVTLPPGTVGPENFCFGCLLEPALDHDSVDATLAADAPAPPAVFYAETGAAPASGTRFAHYELAAAGDGLPVELGRGAMGVTYRAIDTTLRCAVALKVIDARIAARPRARTRFLREAQAAAGLRHPHVASVFFFGERPEDGQPFYAMELVEGETLHARVRRAGGLPVGGRCPGDRRAGGRVRSPPPRRAD